MPLRELKCSACSEIFTELISSKDTNDFVASAEAGEFLHIIELENGESHECGVCRLIISLPASHSPLGEYPFVTAPWFLPPKEGSDGKLKIQQVEVHSRSHYKRLLRENNIVEPETSSDRLTMYGQRKTTLDERISPDIDGDIKFYNEMKRNPEAARRIISSSVHKRKAAGV